MAAAGDFLLQQLFAMSAGCNAGTDITQREAANPEMELRAEQRRRCQFLSKVRERRANGESLYVIAASLNAMGLRGWNGGRWYAASLYQYLKHEKND